MTALQIVRGHPYLTVKQIHEETSICERTIRERMNEIRDMVAQGIYAPYAIIEDGKKLVNWYVYIHYLTWRKALRDKNLRKTVPAFNPTEIERYSGFGCKCIRLDGEE